MKYRGNGKYTITIKDIDIEDISITDLRVFFNSLDPLFKLEIVNSFNKEYINGNYSFEDIDSFLKEKKVYKGNLSTIFVKDIYKYINIQNNISKKQGAKIIAEKFGKSVKTIEKHLYKKL
ncbi:hypothetical protein [Poseidonibacter lekithochrous]|uniref:hypothetical protein n=1 Tax=Poseidonibacter lekithochrous TaxID=1904463 RepID=UPI000D3B4E92|nr:hypothetical protein [Poseidonibacter lekithochrous]